MPLFCVNVIAATHYFAVANQHGADGGIGARLTGSLRCKRQSFGH
jgi:hypothetical protein